MDKLGEIEKYNEESVEIKIYTGFKDAIGEKIFVGEQLIDTICKSKYVVFKDENLKWLGVNHIYYVKIWTGEYDPLVCKCRYLKHQ